MVGVYAEGGSVCQMWVPEESQAAAVDTGWGKGLSRV